MNSSRSRFVMKVITVLTICSMLLTLVMPTGLMPALAQDETPAAESPVIPSDPTATDVPPTEVPTEAVSPTDVPTEEVTAVPTEVLPTDVPTDIPTEVSTELPVDVPTDVPTEITPTITETATEVPVVTAFSDDFQDGVLDGWLLTQGWTVGVEGENIFLTTSNPGEVAIIENLSLADLTLAARVQLTDGGLAVVRFRAGAEYYAVVLDAAGNVSLFRSGLLVGQGSVNLPVDPTQGPQWHTLNVSAVEGLVTVSVNGADQITFQDPQALGAGAVYFELDASSIGTVKFDQIVITQPDPQIVLQTPEVSVTETPVETATTVPEATETVTSEPTTVSESTEQAVEAPEGTLLLSADFEEDLIGWSHTDGASVLAESEINHALLMTAGSSLLPAEALTVADFRFDARLNILSQTDAGMPAGLAVAFRSRDGQGYVLSIETDKSAFYRNDGTGLVLLGSFPALHNLMEWQTVVLTARGGGLTLSVNGLPELAIDDVQPLLSGQFALIANGGSSVLVDDLALTDLGPAASVANPTPALFAFTEVEKAKLPESLVSIVETFLSGDESGALATARENFLPLDELNRLIVEVYAADGLSGADIAPLITAVGGAADFVTSIKVEARLPLGSFVALVNVPQIKAILSVSLAASTSPQRDISAAPVGSAITEGYDLVSANDWHLLSVRGAGSRVAIIDTGFAGAGSLTTELSCVANRTSVYNAAPLAGEGSHGARVAEIVCDLAPNAVVTLYRAYTDTQLSSAVTLAASTAAAHNNSIILIAMDLGVIGGPGDGTDGMAPAVTSSTYDAIQTARQNGRLVIASAGNNNGRLQSFTYNGSGTTTLTITNALAGDRINIAWNDWDSLQNGGGTREDLTTDVSGVTTSVDSATRVVNPIVDTPTRQYTLTANCVSCTLNITALTGSSSYVQVQLTGGGSLSAPSGSGFSGAQSSSSIGRPADSPYVLTVGAVCAYQRSGDRDLNYDLMASSSRGPIFSAGGGVPNSSPAQITLLSPAPSAPFNPLKPDLVGLSDVTTSATAANPPGICDEADGLGFSGTSAAAAHVAGMAALIRSNANANIASTTADGITDYLRSHTIDLYDDGSSSEPNGFDNAFGAGLSVLGNPAPAFPIKVGDPTSFSDAVCATGTTRYVNPNNFAGIFNVGRGGKNNPYVHVAEALAEASANDCVVLYPGDYVTGLAIENTQVANGVKLQAYSLYGAQQDSTFWVNNSVIGSPGIAIGTSTNPAPVNFALQGFRFISSRPLGQVSGSPPFASVNPPEALQIANADGAQITNVNFSGFVHNQRPMSISNNSVGVTISDASFVGSDAQGGSALLIQDSGTAVDPIKLEFVNFTSNISSRSSGGSLDDSTVTIAESVVNIFNSRFTGNTTATIVRVVNDSTFSGSNPLVGTKLVQFVGNLFSDNTNSGPVIYLDENRQMRFINNTVVGNRGMNNLVYGGILTRDNASVGGAVEARNAFWDIFNNLFFNNTAPSGIAVDKPFDSSCPAVLDGTDDSGMRNNWIYQSGATTGDCGFAVSNLTYKNETDEIILPLTDPASDFIGTTIAPNDPYQLRGDSFGVDKDVYGNSLLPGGTITLDLLKKPRVDGVSIDVGAYEFKQVTASALNPPAVLEDAVAVSPDPAAFPAPVRFFMDDGALGGFPPYSFTITQLPGNYSADPANVCGGLPLKLEYDSVLRKTRGLYCPPADFYTGAPGNASVVFKFLVSDSSGNTSENEGTGTITINPVADAPLSTALDSTVIAQSHTGPGAQPISFRVRPFARFNNFRIVRPGTQSDFPYDYSNCVIDAGNSTPGLFSGDVCAAINGAGADGLVTLQLNPNVIGVLQLSYRATDSQASQSVNNTLKIRVVGSLPSSGLHDDTSFAFDYRGASPGTPGSWSPVYSEPNINNSLHTSLTAGDTSEFLMKASGFALYMQGVSTGGLYELFITNDPDATNPAAGSSAGRLNWNGQKVATISLGSDTITCRTSAVTGVSSATLPDNKYYISNMSTAPYVVSCTGLDEDEGTYVRVIQRQAARAVSIDAIGILDESSPLLAGFHEVTETQLLPVFSGWTTITDIRASGQRSVVQTSANAPDAYFLFKGTGVAIGTILERNAAGLGAVYDICVAPSFSPLVRVCQTFNNADGATTVPTFNVFRPFFGYDPSQTYIVTIDLKSLPVGGRLLIDSIVVFDQQPTSALPFGTIEDNQLGPIVFGNGAQDSWSLDTANTRASSLSLTSVSSLTKAGPFFSFRIPESADVVLWYLLASTVNSRKVLVCVDRAQGDVAGTQSTHCKQYDTVVSNPVIIRELDFDLDGSGPGTGWGSSWNASSHTIEVFSLVNSALNVDRIQVLNSSTALQEGFYDDIIPNIRTFIHDVVSSNDVYTLNPVGANGNFTNLVDRLASGGTLKLLSIDNASSVGVDTFNVKEGVLFQFYGTGFSTNFLFNLRADAVRICWLSHGTNVAGLPAPDSTLVGSVLNSSNPNCQVFDNQSSIVRYNAARTIAGLPQGYYTAAVQILADQGEPTPHIVTATPITMTLDAIQVFNTALPVNVLDTPGTRYEPSFASNTDGRFIYLGTGWRSVSGTTARLYSGQNYDSTAAAGAAIVFRTANANRVTFARDIRTGYAPIQVCVMRVSDSVRSCTLITNTGGTGISQPISFPLLDSTAHVVTISLMDAATFNLDWVEVSNRPNSPPSSVLGAGVYDENHSSLVYSNTTDTTRPIRSNWVDVIGTSYIGGGAMSSAVSGANVRFTFRGTGFALFTQFDSLSSILDVDIDGVNNDYLNNVVTNTNAVAVYGSSHVFAGLPLDTYTVTITENDPSKNRFVVDGLEVFGDYDPARVMAAGLYDSAALNAAGNLYLVTAPQTNAWTSRSTVGYFNLTNLYSTRFGATVTFQVDNAGIVTLFHKGTTTARLRVCVVPVAGSTQTCGETTTAPGRSNTSISLVSGISSPTADIALATGTNTPGDYIVSVTNLNHTKPFIVDAVGVYDTTTNTLKAGMYPENHPLLNLVSPNNAFKNTWLAAPVAEISATDGFVKSTGLSAVGSNLSFTFNGTGFSIILSENTLTSQNYTLCVDQAAGGACDVINGGSAATPLALAPVGPSAARRPVALTYVGFAAGTYTVTLTQNDATKPLLIDRVDILGALSGSQQIADAVTGAVENIDSRLIFFPYFNATVGLVAGASGGSQHVGSMQGAGVYFELDAFTGSGFEFLRQTSTTLGPVQVCTGEIGSHSGLAAACTTNVTIAPPAANPILSTSTPYGLAKAQAVEIAGTSGQTRWVFLRKANGAVSTVDAIRPTFDPNSANRALTSGIYEDTLASIRYFTEAAGTYTAAPIGSSGNFVDLANPSASGGSVKFLSADQATPGDGLNFNEGFIFQFNGTGFGVRFTQDASADAVKICWQGGLVDLNNAGTFSTAINSILTTKACQTFDNQSSAARYQTWRVVRGLAAGDYTVVVQMLPDNGVPSAHAGLGLPIKMQFDGLQVFDEVLPTNILGDNASEFGVRHETSFAAANANQTFSYYGVWRSLSGTLARLYSGQNVDITTMIGASVTFQTQNANALLLYRETRSGYAPIQVCSRVAPFTDDSGDQFCTVITNITPIGYQQAARVYLNDPAGPNANNTSLHVVTITTLDAGTFSLDAIEIVDATSGAALKPGVYEDIYPALTYTNGTVTPPETAWSSVFLTTVTAGRYQQSSDGEAFMKFRITEATGFAVGVLSDRFGGEVEVCYDTDADWNDGTNNCVTHQHETLAVNNLTSRSVSGLDSSQDYYVRVRNVEDGNSVLSAPPGLPRAAAYSPARLRIDYVEVFGAALPPVVPAGLYDDTAASSGVPYLQVLPASRWNTFTGTVARNYSNSAYTAVVDNTKRVSSTYAGPSALLRVTVPSGAGAAGSSTVVLYTPVSTTASLQLLICANEVDDNPAAPAGNCFVYTGLRTSSQIVLNESNLSALGVDGATVNISFRTLTPGGFVIDGYQVIDGVTLIPGVYDDFFFGPTNLIRTGLSGTGTTGSWTLGAVGTGSYRGRLAVAASAAATNDDPTLTFDFTGTGFSIITQADANGMDFRLCYVKKTNFVNNMDDPGTTGEICTVFTTDTTPVEWVKRMGSQPLSTLAYQYGFTVPGLPNDTYTAELRLNDTVVATLDRLRVDAVVIHGVAATTLTPGTLYDDRQAGLLLSPSANWTLSTSTLTPPRGPWLRTETVTTSAGAIAQTNVTGNAVVLYQSAGARGSRFIRLCVSTVGRDQQCSEFSQFVTRNTFFTPVVFYGLGTGSTHLIVLENRDPGRNLSIDAIRVLP